MNSRREIYIKITRGENNCFQSKLLQKMSWKRKYEDLVGKLRDKVECPVCLELPRQSPVHVCPNGHVVCAGCVRTQCPTCRTNMKENVISTSLLATTVLENIDHKCNYCDLYFPLENLTAQKKM